MFWLILWIVFILIGIGLCACVALNFFGEEGTVIIGVLILITGIIGASVFPFVSMFNKQYVATWNQVKATYEELSTDELNNISIGVEIAKKNEALFDHQFFVKNYKFFTTMPNEVLDLKPIKTVR